METTLSSQDAQAQSSYSRLVWLITLLLLLLWSWVLVIPRDMMLVRTLNQKMGWGIGYKRFVPKIVPTLNPEQLTLADAALGTQLPSSAVVQKIKSSAYKQAKAHLVVFIGACAECISNRVEDWQQEAKKLGLGYIMVTSSPESNIKAFAKKHKIVVPIISDERETLFRLLNVRWAGRPYLFSKDWKLIWQENKMHIDFNLFADAGFQSAVKMEGVR